MSVATKSPKEIIERLNISASEWCNGTEPEDDVTFVVVKVKNLNGSNLNT
jgi:serine phosphatase RsbU (regulator of sigma subunit)